MLLADEARLAERGIDRLDGLVIGADLDARLLRVDSDDGEVEAEAVVLATGLRYGAPPIPGIEAGLVNADPSRMTLSRRCSPRERGGSSSSGRD